MIVTKIIVSTLLLKVVGKNPYVYRNIAINEIKSRGNLKGSLEVIDISERVIHISNRHESHQLSQFRKNYAQEGNNSSNDKMLADKLVKERYDRTLVTIGWAFA